jgi:hypothetical protein
MKLFKTNNNYYYLELVIVALMQNKLFISYNILWQEQVTFDDDDCVRFVIDQHTKLNFYSAEANIKMYEFTFMCSVWLW